MPKNVLEAIARCAGPWAPGFYPGKTHDLEIPRRLASCLGEGQSGQISGHTVFITLYMDIARAGHQGKIKQGKQPEAGHASWAWPGYHLRLSGTDFPDDYLPMYTAG